MEPVLEELKVLSDELQSHSSNHIFDKNNFLKRTYKIVKDFNILDIEYLYNRINQETARQMDKEFIKMIFSRFNKDDYQTPIAIFDNYWKENRGMAITGGLDKSYSLPINSKALFIVLVINNSLEDLLLLITIIAKRFNNDEVFKGYSAR